MILLDAHIQYLESVLQQNIFNKEKNHLFLIEISTFMGVYLWQRGQHHSLEVDAIKEKARMAKKY